MNVPFTILQVDPGVKEFSLYSLTLADGTLLGQLLVARTSHRQYEALTEYWSLTQAGLDGVATSDTIVFDGVSYDWDQLGSTTWPGTNPLPMFSMPAEVTWEASSAPENVFATNAEDNVALNFGLTYDEEWGGDLIWYQTGSAEFVITIGTTTLRMTEEPAGESWTSATLEPTVD